MRIENMLTTSDMQIIKQALEEFEESEYAGDLDINRARVALGRINLQLSFMEQSGSNAVEMNCHGQV